MPSKRQREQRNAARAASVEFFKRRRLRIETSSVHDSLQPSVDNDKPDTTDTRDKEETTTWLCNEGANETDSKKEEEGSGDVDGKDLEGEQSKTEQAVSPNDSQIELKWKTEGEQNLRGGYGKGSKRTQMRHNKSARDLETEASKTHNIHALWQRSQDLGMTSKVNSPFGLEQPMELPPNNGESSTLPLFQTPRGCPPPLLQQQIDKTSTDTKH